MIRCFKLIAFTLSLSYFWNPALLAADALTLDHINMLPTEKQVAWKAYLKRSHSNAKADVVALQAEVAAQGLSQALRAPNGGDFRLQHRPGDPWYAGEDAQALADVVLSYQSPTGG